MLEEAKAAFTDDGPDVPLEEIARRAEVGIGTLYRHFPSREAMLEAVYRREAEQLAVSADRLLADLDPGDALAAWMRLLVDYVATKKVIAPALGARADSTSELYSTASGTLHSAVDRLLARAIAAGDVRPDVKTVDIIQILTGIAYNAADPDWRVSALRLIDIMMAGLRTPRS